MDQRPQFEIWNPTPKLLEEKWMQYFVRYRFRKGLSEQDYISQKIRAKNWQWDPHKI